MGGRISKAARSVMAACRAWTQLYFSSYLDTFLSFAEEVAGGGGEELKFQKGNK